MMSIFAKHWWLLALRGAVAFLFAVVAFSLSHAPYAALATSLAAYLLADGLLTTYSGWRLRCEEYSGGVLMAEGLVGIVLALVIWLGPVNDNRLVYLFASWCILTGLLEVWLAYYIRKAIEDEWQLVVAGIISVGLGVVMLFRANSGTVALAWYSGFYAVFFGLLLIGVGLRLRRWLAQ